MGLCVSVCVCQRNTYCISEAYWTSRGERWKWGQRVQSIYTPWSQVILPLLLGWWLFTTPNATMVINPAVCRGSACYKLNHVFGWLFYKLNPLLFFYLLFSSLLLSLPFFPFPLVLVQFHFLVVYETQNHAKWMGKRMSTGIEWVGNIERSADSPEIAREGRNEEKTER